jgi:hypothetical protein
MAPRYELTEKTFLAPHLLHPGSVIESSAEPGRYWKPLNDEARAAKEAWYDKDFDVEEGGKIVKKKLNAIHRASNGALLPDSSDTVIISEAADNGGEKLMSLAEANISRGVQAESIDRVTGKAKLNIPTADPATFDETTAVLSAAPAPKKV